MERHKGWAGGGRASTHKGLSQANNVVGFLFSHEVVEHKGTRFPRNGLHPAVKGHSRHASCQRSCQPPATRQQADGSPARTQHPAPSTQHAPGLLATDQRPHGRLHVDLACSVAGEVKV